LEREDEDMVAHSTENEEEKWRGWGDEMNECK
jgi:hypothetical protein